MEKYLYLFVLYTGSFNPVFIYFFPPQTAIEKLSADYLTMFHFPPLIKVMEIVFTK